ncbi:MAG: preprotein translocase subunit YajC [Sphingomicrobium sp.]
MSIATLLSTSTASSAGAASGPASAFVGIFPFLMIGIIFYFLMMRPQQRRLKEHQATIAAVKKGDDVITAGGIRGRVTKVSDDEAEVEIATGVRVRVVKSTLTSVINKSAKAAND